MHFELASLEAVEHRLQTNFMFCFSEWTSLPQIHTHEFLTQNFEWLYLFCPIYFPLAVNLVNSLSI